MANAKTGSKTKKEPVAKKENEENQVKETKPIIPKEIDMNMIIPVRNGTQGKLVYESSKTKEIYRWDSFGDEQDFELKELRNAKSSCKKFFINNWFMFNDEDKWVLDYLGVSRYYKDALSIDNFDDIFTKPVNEVKEIISKLSEGQKRSVSYRARQLIEAGEIDSHKMISALENCLNTQLIEK